MVLALGWVVAAWLLARTSFRGQAAFEFGANASINLGVASGGVHIMAGIYFSMQVDNGKTKATLQGYLLRDGARRPPSARELRGTDARKLNRLWAHKEVQ